MAGQNVKIATDDLFETEILKSSTPVLVDFWATWCGPCRALAPVLDELAGEYAGKLSVYKLDVDDNPNTAARYGIRGVPTVILFKDGQVAEQFVGVLPKAEIQRLIAKNV